MRSSCAEFVSSWRCDCSAKLKDWLQNILQVGAAIGEPNSKVGFRISNKLALQLQSQTQRLVSEYLTS
jgi:hypothetical protein